MLSVYNKKQSYGFDLLNETLSVIVSYWVGVLGEYL